MAITLTIKSIGLLGANIVITMERSDNQGLESISLNTSSSMDLAKIAIKEKVIQVNKLSTTVANLQNLIGLVF